MVNHTRNKHRYTVFIIKLYFSGSRECSKDYKNESGETISDDSNNHERQNMSTYNCDHLVLVQHLLYINTHNL